MFSPVSKDYRRFANLRGTVITVEGLIGIGKTTLGQAMVAFLNQLGLNARFFPEYVNREFLGKYIANMEEYSFSFQLFMLQKRIEIYREAQAFARTGGIAIIDRSLNGDYTFALMQKDKGFFDDEKWGIYNAILQGETIPEPSITLYLVCTPETSLRRVHKRGNEEEIRGYTLEYMEELAAAYNKSMKVVKHPVLTVEWEYDVPVADLVAREVLTTIQKRLFT